VTTAAIRFEGPAPEQQLARDLARRALPVAPVFILVGAFGWGYAGALSAGYGVALVVANFLLAAALITWAGRISLGFLMGAVLGGYILRLGLLAAAVLLVRDASWVEPVPLGLTVVVTHLGLLIWETRYVSASLAFPVLKPRKGALR
jgi:hypothetical protein